MSVPSTASLQKTVTLPYISTWISRSGVLPFRKIPSDIWLLGCAQWIPQGQPYDDLVPENTNTGVGIGYLLEQGQRRRRYNSSFDDARTMNCSLNNNTNHDPITKSGFTIQPLQKKVYFTRSICSAIVWRLWKFLQDHKRSPSSTSTTSVHSRNVSIVIASGKKQEQQVRGSKQFGQGETYFWGFQVVRLPLVKTFVANSRDFIQSLYDGFTCCFDVTSLQTGDFVRQSHWLKQLVPVAGPKISQH